MLKKALAFLWEAYVTLSVAVVTGTLLLLAYALTK